MKDFFLKVILPVISLFVLVFVIIMTLAWIFPNTDVEKHANNIYCETDNPAFSFKYEERCFIK